MLLHVCDDVCGTLSVPHKGKPVSDDVLGVHEFRASVSDLLERLREDPQSAPVVVGAYRRPEAVFVSIDRYKALVTARGERRDHPDLPAIQAQLARSPQERLDGLRRAADFFAAAERSS
jgi:hypothetical protein